MKVSVRCRPMSADETRDGRACIMTIDTVRGEMSIRNPKSEGSEPPKTFTFDYVYDWNAQQEKIYTDTGYPIVESVLEGYNGTIFAYGQTGTGKTFTMEGKDEPNILRGIIPRTFEQIFFGIEQHPDRQFLVRVSFLEIYNEEIHDLLAKQAKSKLDLKEGQEGGFYVKDLSSFVVKEIAEMKEVMETGRKSRHVGETLMNRDSSRSHSIFQITVETSDVGPDGQPHYRVGKLNLVDLAGSERQSKTGSTGDRLKEATNINKSLLTLGNVISALVDGVSTHVPYRDSKLTKLLMDSLGGNTKTVMIANVGPADWNYDETISTLRYANRAKSIKNKPHINEDPKDALLREFQEEILRLRAQLELQGGGGVVTGPDGVQYIPGRTQVVEKVIKVEDSDKIREFEEKLEREKEEIRLRAQQEMRQIEAAKHMAEAEKTQLIENIQKKEEENRRAKEHQQKLLKKLKNMEEKLVTGSQMMEQAVRQEQELQRTQQELERRQREDEEKMRVLRVREEENFLLEQKFSTLKEEIDEKDKKLKKLWTKYQVAQAEVNDLQREFQREKEDMIDTIRFLTRQIKLKSMILENFVPPNETLKVEKRAIWSEEEDEFVVPKMEISGNSFRVKRPGSAVGLKKPTSEYARIARNLGEPNPRYRQEDIINLDLDLPERTTEEYDGLVSPKVQNVVQSLLNDLDDDMIYVPLDSNGGSYMAYDEAAMREEQKRKQQGRLKSATKRPSTASRKGRKPEAGEETAARQPANVEYPKARGLVSRGFQ